MMICDEPGPPYSLLLNLHDYPPCSGYKPHSTGSEKNRLKEG